MKKILFALTATLAFISCSEDDFGTNGSGLGTLNYTVTVLYDDNNPTTTNGGIVANAQVTLINTSTSDTYEVNTNAAGQATLTNLLPGTYNIKAIKTFTNQEFENLFGYPENDEEIVFNGALNNTIINVNLNTSVVEIKQAKTGDLLIKQVYYAGSNASQGAVMRDQFIEIYNNSNEVLYADGLYIAQLFGSTTINPSTANAPYSLSTGQWDWAQSIGMNLISGNANTDYVYADYVIQIPGNGTQYPIQPGQSIVVAQTAVNHKAPVLNNAGNPITINNPDLTIDLSEADFEAYLGDFRISIGEQPLATDLENPAVPNVLVAYWGIPGSYFGNKDMILDPQGRDSFAIFKDENFINYRKFTTPNIVNPVANSAYYIQIPVNKIIDGVETQYFNPSSPRPKMLPSDIDASAIATAAAYNSTSIIRKTKTETPTGRKILKDTNNSSEDFVVVRANPRGFAE